MMDILLSRREGIHLPLLLCSMQAPNRLDDAIRTGEGGSLYSVY